jgi:hypothetical protein
LFGKHPDPQVIKTLVYSGYPGICGVTIQGQ